MGLGEGKRREEAFFKGGLKREALPAFLLLLLRRRRRRENKEDTTKSTQLLFRRTFPLLSLLFLQPPPPPSTPQPDFYPTFHHFLAISSAAVGEINQRRLGRQKLFPPPPFLFCGRVGATGQKLPGGIIYVFAAPPPSIFVCRHGCRAMACAAF